MDKTAPWSLKNVSGSKNAGDVLYVTPDPEPDGARVKFFTRRGGVSKPPFHSLNVSVKVGDSREAVAENLDRIKKSMDGKPSSWVQQVSGDEIKRVEEPGFAGQADALITGESDLPLVVAVADCVPVALVGERGIGMVHSGWRGTISGIVGKTAEEMGEGSLRAYIGPCIRRCCYEVSEGLADEFAGRFGPQVVSGRNLSLPAAIKANLSERGVEEVYDLGLCTGCRADLFYSHRKQGPHTGRSLASVEKVL